MEKKKSRTPWYFEETGFFGPGYLKEYESYLTQEKTAKEVDFLEKVFTLKNKTKVFDCPCGYGRHSIELARRGYEVTGQDISALFLNKAKKEAECSGTSIRWVKGDMREIHFEEEFDVALCLFSSLGYLENDEEHQRAINQITKTLKRGGRFVLDVINRDRFIRTYQERTWKKLPDGSIIISEHDFDHTTGRNLEKRIRIWANGKREEVFHFVRMYTIPELTAMFHKAGLTAKEMYGDFDASSITLHSRRYILIAERS
jgi:SAM-dependent methyltransferase